MTSPGASSSASLTRELLSLAWPAVLQGLVATVVLFTDRLILGRYATEAIGSMGISGPVLWSVFSVFGAYSAGIIAVIGRAVGARSLDRVARILPAVLRFAAGVGLVVAIVGILTRHAIAEGLSGGSATSEQIQTWAADYMLIVFAAAPLHFVATAGMTALQAGGDTRTPMWVSAAAGLTNLGVSVVLVYGLWGLPELGVTGAALGTASAFALELALTLWALRRSRGPVRLGMSPPAADPSEGPPLRSVLKVSAPTFSEKILYHSGYVAFTALIGHLGDVPLAAHQALLAIESVSFISADAFGIAAGALVAMKLGGERPDEAEQVGWRALWISAGVLSLVSLVFLLVPEACVAIFTDDPEVIRLGAQCLRVAAVAQPLMAITDAMAGALRGAGDTKTPMRAAVLGPILVRLSACAVLAYPMGLGLLGIWIGSTLDWVVRATWLTLAFRRGDWRHIEVDVKASERSPR